jgi:hypothetical protein
MASTAPSPENTEDATRAISAGDCAGPPARIPARLLADAIDLVLVAAVVASLAQPYTLLLVLACLTAYYSLLTWLVGQTVGKLLLGLVVQRSDGESIGLLRAIARSILAVALVGLTLASLLLDRRRRALHDLATGTEVRVNAERVRRAAGLVDRLAQFLARQRAELDRRRGPYLVLAALFAWLASAARVVRGCIDRLIPGVPAGDKPSVIEVLADRAVASVGIPVAGAVWVATVAIVPPAADVRDVLVAPRNFIEASQPPAQQPSQPAQRTPEQAITDWVSATRSSAAWHYVGSCQGHPRAEFERHPKWLCSQRGRNERGGRVYAVLNLTWLDEFPVLLLRRNRDGWAVERCLMYC